MSADGPDPLFTSALPGFIAEEGSRTRAASDGRSLKMMAGDGPSKLEIEFDEFLFCDCAFCVGWFGRGITGKE
ncbi:MAG: hypothetical protein M1817_002222 [Caeruleum heppii]|nr:MAG: hypothetical protein M1817_002222 [Caeruleum heppii]